MVTLFYVNGIQHNILISAMENKMLKTAGKMIDIRTSL